MKKLSESRLGNSEIAVIALHNVIVTLEQIVEDYEDAIDLLQGETVEYNFAKELLDDIRMYLGVGI